MYSKILFFMLQLVGLLPVSLSIFSIKREVVHNSVWRIIYSILCALFFSIIYFLRIWIILIDMATPSFYWSTLKSRAEVFLAIANFFSTFLCCIVSFYLAIFRIQEKIALLKSLKEADFLLHKKFTFYKPTVLSFFNIFHVSALIVINTISGSSTFVDATAQLSKLINTFALLEFMEIVLIIKRKFIILNRLVADTVLQRQSKHTVWTSLPSVEISRTTECKTLNVSKLSEIHWTLCRLVLNTADFYGPQLVVMMVYIFTHLIFIPYYLFLLQR